jgi:hypothetical protein
MTLNEIVQAIKTLGDDHRIIQTTANSTAIDALDTELTYPVMTFTIDTARVNGQVIVYDVAMFFFDRLMQGNDNEREVQSDQLEIAKDIIAQLRWGGQPFAINDAANITMFTDSTPELLAGVNVTLSIEIPFASDRCAAPSDYDYILD